MDETGAAIDAATADPAAAQLEEIPAFNATAAQQRRRDRNQLQFRGTAKSDAHAAAVLGYLHSFPEITAAASRNVAITKLLLMLDPQQDPEDRHVLVKSQQQQQDVEMRQQEEPATPNTEATEEIQELQTQIGKATANMNHLARKLSLDISVNSHLIDINTELRNRQLIQETRGRPPKAPDEGMTKAHKGHIAGALLDKWDEEAKTELGKDTFGVIDECCSKANCKRHQRFTDMLLSCNNGKFVKDQQDDALKVAIKEADAEVTARKALHAPL